MNIWEVWFLAIVLRYKDGDIRVLLVGNCGWVIILVLKVVIPQACMYGEPSCDEVRAWFIFDCLPYEWRSGTSDGLFLPNYPPRSMCISTLFQGLLNFCNKYVSSFWLMLRPWIIRTLTLPSLLASSVPCISLYHLESWCKRRRRIQTPWYDMLFHIKATLYLPQNSHHTYLLWHFNSHSEIYCHASSIVPFYYDTHHHCHIAFICMKHSYKSHIFILVLSCNFLVVSK